MFPPMKARKKGITGPKKNVDSYGFKVQSGCNIYETIFEISFIDREPDIWNHFRSVFHIDTNPWIDLW